MNTYNSQPELRKHMSLHAGILSDTDNEGDQHIDGYETRKSNMNISSLKYSMADWHNKTREKLIHIAKQNPDIQKMLNTQTHEAPKK